MDFSSGQASGWVARIKRALLRPRHVDRRRECPGVGHDGFGRHVKKRGLSQIPRNKLLVPLAATLPLTEGGTTQPLSLWPGVVTRQRQRQPGIRQARAAIRIRSEFRLRRALQKTATGQYFSVFSFLIWVVRIKFCRRGSNPAAGWKLLGESSALLEHLICAAIFLCADFSHLPRHGEGRLSQGQVLGFTRLLCVHEEV